MLPVVVVVVVVVGAGSVVVKIRQRSLSSSLLVAAAAFICDIRFNRDRKTISLARELVAGGILELLSRPDRQWSLIIVTVGCRQWVGLGTFFWNRPSVRIEPYSQIFYATTHPSLFVSASVDLWNVNNRLNQFIVMLTLQYRTFVDCETNIRTTTTAIVSLGP